MKPDRIRLSARHHRTPRHQVHPRKPLLQPRPRLGGVPANERADRLGGNFSAVVEGRGGVEDAGGGEEREEVFEVGFFGGSEDHTADLGRQGGKGVWGIGLRLLSEGEREGGRERLHG